MDMTLFARRGGYCILGFAWTPEGEPHVRCDMDVTGILHFRYIMDVGVSRTLQVSHGCHRRYYILGHMDVIGSASL